MAASQLAENEAVMGEGWGQADLEEDAEVL